MKVALIDLVRELCSLNDGNLAERVIKDSDVQWCLSELLDILEQEEKLNEPLTPEELREMDEPTPVWWEKAGYWCLCERGFIITPNGNIHEFEEYNWTFYRRPPEGEEEKP